MSDRLGQVEATMGDATAREVAARALSVSALKSAVDSGRPYETELAAVKAGLPSDIDLQALEAHAKTGVEPVSVLIAQFPAVARQVYQTFSEPDRSGDVLDSFLASARSLVAVRGPGDADGTGPEAVLRRMENAVSSGKLQEAITAYDSLPESAQAAASDWVTRARARVAVDTLTDQASQEVLTALSAKDS
ncbi:COG4223 family protein [Roseibium denhamense]|uniref:COG4223 family protein n=1 Tax=Roseibium denhamense TaxID=76305 RepID=UPI001AD8BCB2|nr:mitofilin family membrane protein [Roseibium denhamense]